jgi:hypothetical protein
MTSNGKASRQRALTRKFEREQKTAAKRAKKAAKQAAKAQGLPPVSVEP